VNIHGSDIFYMAEIKLTFECALAEGGVEGFEGGEALGVAGFEGFDFGNDGGELGLERERGGWYNKRIYIFLIYARLVYSIFCFTSNL
jgi:hypothetical protein